MADEMDGVTPDPFALRAHVVHPALAQNKVVGADIDPGLFEKFFQSPVFRAWSTGDRLWQLHCCGEPGCGKTTVAAVAASRLPQELNGAKTTVASISISEHVASTSLTFVEDLFQCVRDSFGDQPSDEFTAYQHACEAGQPVVDRIHKLSVALSSVSHGKNRYLILDGYDRINEALQTFIDFQLSLLQTSGMKIMTTRRVPVFSAPLEAVCDECEREPLELWWACNKCEIHFLCYGCRNKKELTNPHVCEEADFEETYLHVSVKLGGFSVEDFVANRIKFYHSNVEADVGTRIADHIKRKVEGNITLALLYLEDIFSRDDFASFNKDRVDDRLPRDVIAFFDVEMKSIENRPEPQRLPPLLAITAAAHTPNGIPLAKLEECIRVAQNASLNLEYPRSVEDVIKAANGWLTNPPLIDREVDICCKPAFALYVKEDYNESFTWAKRQLGYDTEYKAAAVTSKPLFETPQTLEGVRSSPPETAKRPNHRTNRPLFVNQEKGMVHSPPRMNSVEDLTSPALELQLNEISLSGTTMSDLSSHHSKKTVCDFCTSHVLDSGASSGQHHISAHKAETSSDQCIFCSSLYSTDSTTKVSKDGGCWPLYNWTFRALPRGRELKGSMMLRFWPTHSALVSKSFQFLPAADVPVPSPNQLQYSTDPKESGGNQIKEWMETCTRHHVGCRQDLDEKRLGASFLPTRLIDVDTGDDEIVRLIETKVTKVKGPYCTLSHAWGQAKLLTTDVWNMAKHLLVGIKMSELTTNFRQAIEVTRFLKIRYIWIDSLAIVQAPHGDFHKEGVLMHKVYRHSFCNLVAADSMDGSGGLFRQRNPHAVLPVGFQGTGTNYGLGTKAWTIVPTDMWERELLNSFIYTRGWVFQERMLSPRILHFTRHQIFWDCSTLSACEAFPSGLPFPLDRKASTDRHWRSRLEQSQISSQALSGAKDNESSYTFWMSAVQNYTDCNLTSQGDKTVAIWSVAKLLRDISSEEYAVGMWSAYLVEQLAWRDDVNASERVPELQIDIPSWSWASIKGPILPQHRLATRSYKVKNHKGEDLSFTIKPPKKPDEELNRDEEPKLESKMLAIAGCINDGTIIAADGGYRLQVPRDHKQPIHLDAFPDEPLASTGSGSCECAFVILAASASNTIQSPSVPGDIPSTKTYSGIGLLLTKASLWYEYQKKQYHAFQEASGSGEWPRETHWRMAAFEELLRQRPQTGDGLIYRRMGAVHFRDVDERTYEWLQRGQPCKFWIQ